MLVIRSLVWFKVKLNLDICLTGRAIENMQVKDQLEKEKAIIQLYMF